LYLRALFSLLIHRPDNEADDDQHRDKDNDCSQNVEHGMLLDEDRGNADEEDQDVAGDDDCLLFLESDMNTRCHNERVIDVKAREHVGRRVDRVEIFYESHKDVVAVWNLAAEINGIGVNQADDDEQCHSGHEHVRCFSRDNTALDTQCDHADDEIRKPHCVWDNESFEYGDLVVQSDVDLVETACGLQALDPEKRRHIEDHINGHREQSQDNIDYLVLKTLVLNNLIHSTLASGYKYAECSRPHPNLKHSHIIPCRL